MGTIYYNSDVAQVCSKNGIIKAILINYVYNYHKPNIRKGPGHPANISLREFVYQYTHEDQSLWKRSFIHRILKDLIKDGFLIKTEENRMPVYSVSDQIRCLLNDETAKTISFDLGMACEHGIYVAIMRRYLLHLIDKNPKGEAYNLKVTDMAEVNRISPAEIYRSINCLVAGQVLRKIKSPLKSHSRALSLARCE